MLYYDPKFKEIALRSFRATEGPWRVNSVQVKNGILNFKGDWPEEHDEHNFEFIANAKTDIDKLMLEVENLTKHNEELSCLNSLLEMELKRLKEQQQNS